MSSSTPSNGLKPMMIASLVGLVLVVVFCNVGCYETGYQNGYIDPWYTSSLGLPESPSSYWERLGWGTQNVASWNGWANPWYTSSLGLPAF